MQEKKQTNMMIHIKTFIFISLLFITGIESLQGQRFNGGISGGFTASQIDGDGWSGYNTLGITAGGFVNTWFSKSWGAQFDLLYAEKGASNSFDPDAPEVLTNQLLYIEMPFVALYQYSSKIQAELGLYPAYLIKAQSKDRGAIIKENTDKYNAFDLGGVAGIRYMFTDNFFARLRFAYSLLPFYKLEGAFRCTPRYASGCYFNNTIQISVNYQFNN